MPASAVTAANHPVPRTSDTAISDGINSVSDRSAVATRVPSPSGMRRKSQNAPPFWYCGVALLQTPIWVQVHATRLAAGTMPMQPFRKFTRTYPLHLRSHDEHNSFNRDGTAPPAWDIGAVRSESGV